MYERPYVPTNMPTNMKKHIDKKDLTYLLEQGETISAIARYFHTSRPTIRKRITEYGLTKIREKGETQRKKEETLEATALEERMNIEREELLKSALNLLDRGKPVDEISLKLGLNKQRLISLIKDDLIKMVINLQVEGLSITEIAKRLGVNRRSIHKWPFNNEFEKLKPNQFEYVKRMLLEGKNPRQISLKLKVSEKEVQTVLDELLVLEFLHLKTLRSLERIFNIDRKNIGKKLRNCGIKVQNSASMRKIREHVNNTKFDREMSTLLNEVLIGELLGDGSLGLNIPRNRSYRIHNVRIEDYKDSCERLKGFQKIKSLEKIDNLPDLVRKFNQSCQIIADHPTAYFQIHKSILEVNWIKLLESLFRQEGYLTNVNKYLRKGRNNKNSRMIYLTTNSTIQFTNVFKNWYRLYDKGKIVPRSFKMTPNILLHWYIGDGHFSSNQIALYTLSFSKEDVQFLTSLLKNQVGIHSQIHHKIDKRYPQNLHWFIVITSKSNIDKFFRYLDGAVGKHLSLAQREFPWKFDMNLKKKDVLDRRRMLGDPIAALYDQTLK
ncbi:MAG: LAGLIDADG family homing endonuclease [Candidatus Thorarchaeota archaeon]